MINLPEGEFKTKIFLSANSTASAADSSSASAADPSSAELSDSSVDAASVISSIEAAYSGGETSSEITVFSAKVVAAEEPSSGLPPIVIMLLGAAVGVAAAFAALTIGKKKK